MPDEAHWVKYAEKHLKGKKIVMVRYLSKDEAKNMGWFHRPLVMQLDDGTIVFPSQDDEGNDGGALFGQSEAAGDLTFPVLQ